jgi:hypothetical protein
MAVRFDRLNSREILGESHPREITMMLHLAQIQQQSLSAQPELRLLAAQEADNKAWTVLTGEVMLPPDRAQQFHPDQLVLADLSEQNEVLNIQDAKEWVLEIVQRYLATGVAPSFLQQEAARAEQWRQSLTLQSQELDRRALEMEARREQIQELEENLKRERQILEEQREHLNEIEQSLEQEKLEIDSMRREYELDN